VAAEVAALASIQDWETASLRIEAIKRERGRLFARLEKVPFLEPVPSQGNYILCRVLDGSARALRDRLTRDGIFIRYYENAELQDYVRISVGRPEHTDRLIAALNQLHGGGGHA
jgi:histidinol-phosphate aminotransferase